MDHEVLLAIIFKKVEERLKSLSTLSRGPRGQRGRHGRDGTDGKDFNYLDHEAEFRALAEAASLKFEDLTAEQIESLRGARGRDGNDGKDFNFSEHEETFKEWARQFALKFDDLSVEQIEKLRGARGREGKRGLDGKNFDFAEHEETLKKWVEEFSLKFEDLAADQIEQLRGPRGKDGRDGKDFKLEENAEEITEILSELIKSMQGSLKLKFSDLSIEDIEQLRGPRGRDGRDGKDFKFEDHEEYFKSLKPKFSDFTPEEVSALTLKFSQLSDEEKASLKLRFEDLSDEDRRSLKGGRGSRGQRGKDGKDGTDGEDGKSIRGVPGFPGIRGRAGKDGTDGTDGRDGKDAPYIIAIEIDQYKSDEFQFIFIFSDHTEIRSDPVKLPTGRTFVGLGMGGGGGGGGSADDTYLYEGWSQRFSEAFSTVGARDTLLQILDFGYAAPLISLTSPVSTAIREKGTVVASVQLDALTTKQADDITDVTFWKNGVLVDTVVGPNPLGGTETYTDPLGFSDTTTYFARVSDGTTTVQSNTLTFQEVYPYYYGVGAPALSAANVALLTKDIIGNTATVARQFSPTAQVYYFAYPAAYPALTSILDKNGFETIPDWTVRIEDITGLDATLVSYRIYEFNNLTTQVSFTNTFRQ